nr:helix-turn-helix transcriptional regulator [Gammaproteobacteria bacterium]
MDKQQVIAALSALAQETRLDIFRYLVEAGPEGVAAGQIGEQLGVPWATLSFHLKTLQQAGLLQRQRQSRSIIYFINVTTMDAVMGYLTENCCQGHPETCGLAVRKPAAAGSADTAQSTITRRRKASTQ